MKISVVIGFVAVAAMLLGMFPANALAAPPPRYDLVGSWSLTYNGYIHTMMISSFNPVTGAFSGIGYYTGIPEYDLTVTGTESGTTINYVLSSTTGSWTGSGTVASCTSMSGTSPVTWSATKGTEVMNVWYNVVNDEAQGNNGWWALKNYVEDVMVWQDPNFSSGFYVLMSDVGTWTTFAGAITPGSSYKAQVAGATGLFQGTSLWGFDAKPPYATKFGFLGTHNYGGSKANVLANVGPPTYFDIVDSTYSPTAAGPFSQKLTYYYGSQTYVSSWFGGTGDIIVK